MKKLMNKASSVKVDAKIFESNGYTVFVTYMDIIRGRFESRTVANCVICEGGITAVIDDENVKATIQTGSPNIQRVLNNYTKRF